MPGVFQNRPYTVIKLGGSLFDLPDLADRLSQFLDSHQFKRPVIIPGGGKFAEEVRRLDEVHYLGDLAVHQLGIQTLAISARFVAELSEKFDLIISDDFRRFAAKTGTYPILDVSDFTLKHCPLSSSWDVTSDSIAAWLASLHPQSELVLLKSVSLPEGLSYSQAADLNYVDAEFPRAAQSLKQVGWCNLRTDDQNVVQWKQHGMPQEQFHNQF